MTDYIKDLYTATFNNPTGCGKKSIFLDLIEKNTTYIWITFSLSAQLVDETRYILWKVDQT